MQLPDYQGGSIVNLMASLQGGLGGGDSDYAPLALLPPDRVRAHRQVLLLVIDGLGLNYLRAHPQAACLNDHLAGGITSVFPPTTATAITTFLTGDAPQQHGLTGWHMYFRELGSVLAVLPGRARYGGQGLGEAGIDVHRLLGTRPFSDRIGVAAYTLSPAHIADSDFNRAHLGGAQSVAYHDLSDMLRQCGELLRSPGPKYVYAYWSELDSLGHRFGIGSEPALTHLLELDRAFEQLLDAIHGTDTLVVVSADHGQIDPPAEHRIDLGDHPRLADCLLLPLCGESRAAYCYLRPGREAQFDEYVRQAFAEVADCLPSAELVASAWFGEGEPHPQLLNRIGDRVLLMKDDYLLKDWLPQEKRHQLIGVHGGLSQDELWVPLIVAGR
ncbi:MAG: alkaline phosphatase family protein [Chromatiaceae bacterium]|jgi:hypothetical protein|nr:alkaline phosphatase family protein [Chromatiaceae bacterium]